MKNNEARFKGKEIAFISGIYYRAMDPAAWQERAEQEGWSEAESELVYEHYERTLDRVEKWLQI
jgi:hypothetical protein